VHGCIIIACMVPQTSTLAETHQDHGPHGYMRQRLDVPRSDALFDTGAQAETTSARRYELIYLYSRCIHAGLMYNDTIPRAVM
jgi:hypothetical protein